MGSSLPRNGPQSRTLLRRIRRRGFGRLRAGRTAAAVAMVTAVVLAACAAPTPDDAELTATANEPSVRSTTSGSQTLEATTSSLAAPVPDAANPSSTSTPSATPTTPSTSSTPLEAGDGPSTPVPTRPDWLGSRPLPTDGEGWVVTPQTTPSELTDRRLATVDLLPPPADDRFAAASGPVPADVVARSTWEEGCPVTLDELSYVTMTFWGFDDRPHTGEMIVNAEAADDVVAAFGTLYENRFPIEEMRVVSPGDLLAPPTGDGNNTTGFVCRPVTGGTRFSEHAFGLAIDINPFHNPYIRNQLILPELAAAYVDRVEAKPGMIVEGDATVQAFDDIGWFWGGRWRSLKDYQHFSLRNR